MSPICDGGFSDHRDGVRPGHRAPQAMEQACHDRAAGYRWVVDSDWEKFFDPVNHDRLMSRVARKITDTRLLKLIRRDLTAGIRNEGLMSPRDAGTPQGSPRSPRVSTILRDRFAKELERRGHRCCREADDANVDVRRQRAGERVMASLTPFLEAQLRLKVHRVKRAVDRPWKRKLLGDTGTSPRAPRLKPALESITRAKARIRQITHQGRGRNIHQVIQEMNRCTRGWIGDVRRSTVPHACEWRDQWRRRRRRKILWEPWRTPKIRDRQRVTLGVKAVRARKATATGRGAWWNAGAHICTRP